MTSTNFPNYKKEEHLNPEKKSTQLLYLESGDEQGPETLLRAIRAYKLLEAVQKRFDGAK